MWDGGSIHLRPKQAALLGVLARRRGHIVSLQTCIRSLWPIMADEPSDPANTLTQHVWQMKPRIALCGLTIKGWWGLGYELVGELEVDWSAS